MSIGEPCDDGAIALAVSGERLGSLNTSARMTVLITVEHASWL